MYSVFNVPYTEKSVKHCRYKVPCIKASPISPRANTELKGLDNTMKSCYNENTL